MKSSRNSRMSAVALLSLFFLLPFTSASSKPTIAIIDEKVASSRMHQRESLLYSPSPHHQAFHLEVVGGLLHVLAPYADTTTLYLHPLNFPGRPIDFGFMDLLAGYNAELRGLPVLSMPHHDVLIFVSPEYRIDYVREFIERSKPKAVVAFIHNGDADTITQMPKLHPNVHIVTLAPHVANFSSPRINLTEIEWFLPLIGHNASSPCHEDALPTCLAGFAIQGAMDSRRRNYSQVWEQMLGHLASSPDLNKDGRYMINVVGSGSPDKLEVPRALLDPARPRVVPHVNLGFKAFYDVIYHNLGLIPTLASDSYYDRKFSSTVISSLVTSSPLIVTQRFLDSYTFLDSSHVFVQREGESTMDAALRLLRTPPAELAALRKAINSKREELNRRAEVFLNKVILDAQSKPDLGPLPQ